MYARHQILPPHGLSKQGRVAMSVSFPMLRPRPDLITHTCHLPPNSAASVSALSIYAAKTHMTTRARQGETVIPGGTGGKTLEAQEHLAEGRSRGGQTRREQLGTEGYQEMGSKGGQTRREQLGTEGYQEMGRKGGLSTMEKSGGERAAEEGINIDESKFKTSSSLGFGVAYS